MDFGLRQLRHPMEIAREGSYRRAAVRPFVAVLASAHRLAARTRLRLEMLRDEPFVIYSGTRGSGPARGAARPTAPHA